MSTSLRTLKGVGEKTEKLFAKIGVTDIESLLSYYPRNYDAYEEPVEIQSLEEGAIVAISATIITGVYVNQVRNLQVITTTAADLTGKIAVTWFNAPYLRSTIRKGSRFILRGRIARKQGKLQMEHPEIFTPAAYEEILHSLQPIYGLTSGLSNKTIVKLIHQVLNEQNLQAEYLADEYKEKYHLADRNFALPAIHFPKNMQELLSARRRLVFDEFLLFILAVQMLKEKTEEAPNAFPMHPVWTTEQIIENLPYDLTKAQLNVWHEIERDLSGQALMSRLIQGDVGSGKTILAFLAMIMTAENGYQAVLMAPTEVLARQHFQAMEKLLQEQQIDFCHPILLTGSDTAKEKREKYALIASKEANLVIGTHALIQEKVQYNNLGLVITDEQHRFGVKQREALTTMGNPPNVLVMSATPIPRTLAIIIYGDLDISVIDELPAQRLPIKNCVVDTSYRSKAYSFMAKQISQGRQVYVICPMVEESEGMDGENVLDYTMKLRNVFPPEIKVAALHGKMKAKEKNAIMEAFAAGEIQILVSTTVVEVGVNVPNATVMMVENAERFGLAQLHQLRGRVGRGEYQSYCIFMQGSDAKETSKRLEILRKSNDGFYIAGEDLKLRGPGDLFGIRQSGLLEFKLGDIYQDADILKAASETAADILSLDEDLSLPQNQELQRKLSEYMKEDLQNLGL
ncbi:MULTISPECIES: ATP-dependent DNA helicase RecG [unclassified Blautia]|uniref:ATP-dependent DNA helicase RecG n=1 Tax=unclassified Blautia TaxID=2648079 RepID=UPI0025C315F8|nr:ATP-dependent DNA helicase RecG [Blautia sp.]MCI6303224.1 ATP-dependent DNA helicase RecG [Blautia sp.]MCI7449442.1 ATP-dependent DNA helicase RecG [Blautia sp.]MDD6413034.1 ATP-dependent DNA helicase RecG [Blautia sp.]MDY4117538.1 ATP-dependent DNA helicase RecG [Blautia sp.]